MKPHFYTVIICVAALVTGCSSTPPAPTMITAESIIGAYLEQTAPAFVIGVIPSSPAALAGIREGDYVLAVDGNTGAQSILHYLAGLPPDSSVSIIYVHDGIQHQIMLKTTDPVRLFTQLQAKGDPAGPTGLAGLELSGGYSLPPGTPSAEVLLNQAVAKDYAPAMANLGNLYMSESDTDRGLALLTQAAQKNDLSAYVALMQYYNSKKDWAHLIEAAQKDAALNDVVGEYYLGRGYLSGMEGLEQDRKKGMEIAQRAAERGNAFAMQDIAAMYAGFSGMPSNIPLAHMWAELALKFGDSRASSVIAYANSKAPLDDTQKVRVATRVNAWMRYFQRTSDPESPGNIALAQSNLYAALQADVQALQGLPDPAPVDVDKRLRQQVIMIVRRLKASPSLPAAAAQYEIYGKTAAQSATGPDGLLEAIENLHKATNVAPWWADGYYNLAVVEDQAQDYADAARNLGFYLLANPHAADANAVQARIYSLQYKAYNP